MAEQGLRSIVKKTNFVKSKNGEEVAEKHDHPRPEWTRYIEVAERT